MAKELIWSARPVLSLIKQFTWEGSGDTQKLLHPIEGGAIVTEVDPRWTPAVWHGPDTETFSNTALSNALKLRIRFKAREPHGGLARFIIWIDRFIGGAGDPWQREIWDPVCFCTPTDDHDNWYFYEREYTLSQDISFLKIKAKKDTELKFKITGCVWVGGSLQSPGSCGEPHSKEFKAILKPPVLSIAKGELVAMHARLEHHGRQFIDGLDGPT